MKLSENSENMSFTSANLIDGCIASKVKIPFFKKGIKQKFPFFQKFLCKPLINYMQLIGQQVTQAILKHIYYFLITKTIFMTICLIRKGYQDIPDNIDDLRLIIFF